MIVKRRHGAIVSTLVATMTDSGKVTIAPQVKAAPVAATKPGKPGKQGATPGKVRNAPAPQAPKDASDGCKFAFKLNHYMTADLPEKDRLDAIYKLGKLAREIGPGDPDVAAAHEKARKDQHSYRVVDAEIDIIGRECVEGSAGAWASWSAAFIAGYVAKVPVKGNAPFKRYLLTVTIQGQAPQTGDIGRKLLDATEAEAFTSRWDLFQQAHRAACRWLTLKSNIAHLMNVTIDTLDPAQQIPGEPPVCITSLRTVVDFAQARDHMVAAERRQNKGPTMFTAKGTQTLRLSLPTCHESRSTFSKG